jgi:hypothetical protein
MSLRRLSLLLVVLPTKVNIGITHHLTATAEWAMDDLRIPTGDLPGDVSCVQERCHWSVRGARVIFH